MLSALFGGRSESPAAEAASWLKTTAQLDALIRDTGFAISAADIRSKCRPCLHLFDAGPAPDAPAGATRFGGMPDLPDEAAWPRSASGDPMTFYGQIALRDLAGSRVAQAFPETGLLTFFAGGRDAHPDRIGVAAMRIPEDARLTRRPSPDGDGAAALPKKTLQPVSVRFEAGLCFPNADHRWLTGLEQANPAGDIDTLDDGLCSAPFPVLGRILGYANWSESDLRVAMHFREIGRAGQERLWQWTGWEEWERAKKIENKLYNGTTHRPWSAADDGNVRWMLDHSDAISDGIEQWQSLLTIESNKGMDLWINDADALYFFIRADDLQRGDFTAIEAIATQS